MSIVCVVVLGSYMMVIVHDGHIILKSLFLVWVFIPFRGRPCFVSPTHFGFRFVDLYR